MKSALRQTGCILAILSGFVGLQIISGCQVYSSGCRRNAEDPFWPDINLSRYEAVEFWSHGPWGGLRFENVRPSHEVDYWEIRHTPNPSPSDVNVQIGTKCGTASDKERCRIEFDALRFQEEQNARDHSLHALTRGLISAPRSIFLSAEAWANGLVPPPGPVWFYIASNHGDENRVWGTGEALLEFLGAIDSKEEAALWVAKDGFYATSEKTNGALREMESGYELIVNKTVTDTSKYFKINRYLLHVLQSGEIKIMREQLSREVEEVDCPTEYIFPWDFFDSAPRARSSDL